MASFEITYGDRSVEIIDGADAYQPEGPLTTFFTTGSDRQVVDSWSVRVASLRTADITRIRRCAAADSRPSLRTA